MEKNSSPSYWRLTALALGAGGLVGIMYCGYVWLSWPDVAALQNENPTGTAFIERYRSRAAADAHLPQLLWRWVKYSAISVHAKRAVIVAEDIEFFSHAGFSTAEIKAAIREALEEGEVPRGASTITQQLAKNLWLSPSRNPLRKFKEAILTRQLEGSLNKRRILDIYLNVVELGRGIYGIGAASQHYFGKPASQLTEREAAMLAASLPRPATWHPGVEDPYYLRYVDDILARMERAQFLWKYLDNGQ